MDDGSALAARVRALAEAEGFAPVRFAGAEPIAAVFEAAIAAREAGRLDGLEWMTEEWLARATDPRRFLEGAKSVIVLALAYSRAEAGSGDTRATGRVAAYASGRDYHRVFEPKLRRLAKTLRDEFGVEARATVDYGPLLERPLAAASGMGWLGKSTMLLVPGFGPWVMLGAVATSLDVPPDPALRKSCGSCNRCIVACPTGAISPEGNVLDARLCISYHTIENRGPIPRELREKFGSWIFGCDDCLDACPVGGRANRGSAELAGAAGEARPELAPLLSLDEGGFRARFAGRPILRAKRDGFLRNVCVALGNVGCDGDVEALRGALHDGSALVRGHAAWAIGRIGERLGTDVAPVLENALLSEEDQFVREELELALAATVAQSAASPI